MLSLSLPSACLSCPNAVPSRGLQNVYHHYQGTVRLLSISQSSSNATTILRLSLEGTERHASQDPHDLVREGSSISSPREALPCLICPDSETSLLLSASGISNLPSSAPFFRNDSTEVQGRSSVLASFSTWGLCDGQTALQRQIASKALEKGKKSTLGEGERSASVAEKGKITSDIDRHHRRLGARDHFTCDCLVPIGRRQTAEVRQRTSLRRLRRCPLRL